MSLKQKEMKTIEGLTSPLSFYRKGLILLTCPICGEKTKVVNSRCDDGETVYRRRECKNCHYRFTTEEVDVALKSKKGLTFCDKETI